MFLISSPRIGERGYCSVRQILFHQLLQQLVPVQLPDQGAGIVVVGDIGRVFREDVADDLVDGVIALLLKGIVDRGLNGLDLLAPVLIEVEFACKIDLHVGNTSQIV